MSYTDIKDRAPGVLGRRLVVPESGGQSYYAKITRADNPTQEGTPLNRALFHEIGIMKAAATRTGSVVSITCADGAKRIEFTAPTDFSPTDTYTLNGTALTLKQLNGDALNAAWIQGAPVFLTIVGAIGFFKAGGSGITKTPVFEELVKYTANATWVCPKNGLYRIFGVGAGGDAYYTTMGAFSNSSFAGGAGAGAGGVFVFDRYFAQGESYEITVNTSMSSFGALASATAGGKPDGYAATSTYAQNGGLAGTANLASGVQGLSSSGDTGVTSGQKSGSSMNRQIAHGASNVSNPYSGTGGLCVVNTTIAANIGISLNNGTGYGAGAGGYYLLASGGGTYTVTFLYGKGAPGVIGIWQMKE